MRIIGGQFRGRSIVVPSNFRGRPTTDFAREGLFNMLESANAISGSSILELFAGTGVFSVECISRGALSAVAVDLDHHHVLALRNNFRLFDLKSAVAQKADVLRWLKNAKGPFDLVFADPPFDLSELPALPALIRESGCVAEGGLLILEHPGKFDFSSEPGFQRSRAFGNVHFSFFRHSQT